MTRADDPPASVPVMWPLTVMIVALFACIAAMAIAGATDAITIVAVPAFGMFPAVLALAKISRVEHGQNALRNGELIAAMKTALTEAVNERTIVEEPFRPGPTRVAGKHATHQQAP